MSDQLDSAPVIDLAEARRARLHDIHEARLLKVRAAFAKALPLPAAPKAGKKNKAKKPRKPKKP